MVFEAVREVPAKAAGHKGRRWQFTAAQFYDRLWRRECGWEPAHAHKFTGYTRGCRRRNVDARPLCSACLQADDESIPQPHGQTRSDERGAVWRFDRQIDERLSRVRRTFLRREREIFCVGSVSSLK